MTECITIDKLRSLRRGDSFMFYKGHAPQYSSKSETPHYDHTIRSIMSEARALAATGKIAIEESFMTIQLPSRRVIRDGKPHVLEYAPFDLACYTATGLQE
jgi:hypothetical protein